MGRAFSPSFTISLGSLISRVTTPDDTSCMGIPRRASDGDAVLRLDRDGEAVALDTRTGSISGVVAPRGSSAME